jgi:hypothetical protein
LCPCTRRSRILLTGYMRSIPRVNGPRPRMYPGAERGGCNVVYQCRFGGSAICLAPKLGPAPPVSEPPSAAEYPANGNLHFGVALSTEVVSDHGRPTRRHGRFWGLRLHRAFVSNCAEGPTSPWRSFQEVFFSSRTGTAQQRACEGRDPQRARCGYAVASHTL